MGPVRSHGIQQGQVLGARVTIMQWHWLRAEWLQNCAEENDVEVLADNQKKVLKQKKNKKGLFMYLALISNCT